MRYQAGREAWLKQHPGYYRPEWDQSTSAEQLALSERESFLEWRRSLVRLQEDDRLIMTPFERNLEFWRQLWRVVEKR